MTTILVHAHDGALVGIDRASGHVIWRCVLPNVRGRVVAMAIDAELVVAACEDGSVFGVDYPTGVGRWQAQFELRSVGGVPPTVFVDAGEIYVGYFGCVTRFSRTASACGPTTTARPPRRARSACRATWSGRTA